MCFTLKHIYPAHQIGEPRLIGTELESVFVRVPDGLVPAQGLYQERQINKLRPFIADCSSLKVQDMENLFRAKYTTLE